MHQPDLAGRFGHGRHPVAQGFLVSMGGVSGKVVDGGLGRGAAFHNGPARGVFGLKSHKEQVVFRFIQAVFQMIDNAAASAHAGTGNDDGRAFEVQQVLVVLELFHGIQVVEPDGVVSGGFQGVGFPVPAVIHVLFWYSRVIWMPSGESMNTGTSGLMRSSSSIRSGIPGRWLVSRRYLKPILCGPHRRIHSGFNYH
jgi:hypothetical protein